MYLIYVFVLFELCLIHVFIQFMYLLFWNSCIYYFGIHVFIIFEYMYLLFLTINNCFYVLFIIILRHIFCYIHFQT